MKDKRRGPLGDDRIRLAILSGLVWFAVCVGLTLAASACSHRDIKPALGSVDRALELLEDDFEGGADISYPDADEPGDSEAAVARRLRMIRRARATLKEAGKP